MWFWLAVSSAQDGFLCFHRNITSDFGATLRLENHNNFQPFCGFGYRINWLFEQFEGNNKNSGIYN